MIKCVEGRQQHQRDANSKGAYETEIRSARMCASFDEPGVGLKPVAFKPPIVSQRLRRIPPGG
jgi:hypothetical protein